MCVAHSIIIKEPKDHGFNSGKGDLILYWASFFAFTSLFFSPLLVATF